MMIKSLMLSALIATAGIGASAQPADGETGVTPVAAPWTPTWSSPEIQSVATMLSGAWKSAPVAQADGAGTVGVVMSIAPVKVDGLPDTLYVEAAREDALFEPYRQAIFQLYTYKSGVRLRTYELKSDTGIKRAIVALSYAPELVTTLKSGDLLATLDIDMVKSGNGYSGKTPYPYPTGVAGAVEMTSEITLTQDSLVSVDRGLAADGSVAWGSKPGDKYEFKRIESPAKVTRSPEGVVWITLKEGEGPEVQSGQLVSAQYTGFFDNGQIFDSSRPRGQAMTFRWPGQMVAGWNTGMAGLKVGERRRLVIPSDQGYGPQGREGRIPPNSRLTFEIECMSIRDAATPEVTAPETPGDNSGH